MNHSHIPSAPALRQRGISLIFALVTLVALMMGALALVRNTDTATMLLGNLGFKQDATYSADQASQAAMSWLTTNLGSLNGDLVIHGEGYYARSMEFDDGGATRLGAIDVTGNQRPNDTTRQLIDWNGDGCADTDSSTFALCNIKVHEVATSLMNGSNNKAKYVILRMCNKEGDNSIDSTVVCVTPLSSSGGQSSARGEFNYTDTTRMTSSSQTYFRILVRIEGPRGATSYTETIVHF